MKLNKSEFMCMNVNLCVCRGMDEHEKVYEVFYYPYKGSAITSFPYMVSALYVG